MKRRRRENKYDGDSDEVIARLKNLSHILFITVLFAHFCFATDMNKFSRYQR